jgi:GMP synthase-like glutamine amidotransferase
MKKLRIHYLQHVPHEGLGSIEDWINSSIHSLTSTMLFEEGKLPDLSEIDWLIVMGGTMSVNDEKEYPWLADEKKFIRKAIDSGKIILGICLGAQLVSASLGARVYKNMEKEIGWYDIELTADALSGGLFNDFGSRFKVFHWHGDTFDLPENATLLASSEACKNQAFIYKDKVLALQFHMEPTWHSLYDMIESGKMDFTPGAYVQSEAQVMNSTQLLEANRKIMFELLARLAELA